MTITAKPNRRQSWEKQAVYNLSNGWKATVEWNSHYGDMITRLDSPCGAYWHCSSGIDNHYRNHPDPITREIMGGPKKLDLPDFARPWIETIAHNRLVRPEWKRAAK